ncbi:MAG: dioxygenase [Acaryochloridaceae cyanobacterium RU_4_10]|nr:dioxygenase [Acaryochloridaceae cyanobacterium RU_4_10]
MSVLSRALHWFSPHSAWPQALATLRQDGVLILGSGLSYHNLRNFGAGGAQASQQFDDWLQQTLVQSDATQRSDKLIDWTAAPAARLAHPREDHLLPLMVAVGAARDEAATCFYHEEAFVGGITVSSFRFGNVVAEDRERSNSPEMAEGRTL